MQLIVSGLNAARAPLRFDHLFGRYVFGFKPWTHCDHCFVARQERAINPNMQDGSYELRNGLFYLCGVGHKLSERLHPELAKKYTNVHLAVFPKKGSVATVESLYGVSFIIDNAHAIPIKGPARPFEGLKSNHSRCKMFRFGHQMFDVGDLETIPGKPVHRLRDQWRSIQEIDKDASGCVIDPALLNPRLSLPECGLRSPDK